jgi:hypothetical protein
LFHTSAVTSDFGVGADRRARPFAALIDEILDDAFVIDEPPVIRRYVPGKMPGHVPDVFSRCGGGVRARVDCASEPSRRERGGAGFGGGLG